MILKFQVFGKFSLFFFLHNYLRLDELIGMLLTSVRHDLISHLRTTLLSHHDNPIKRLQIHKMIFKIQQMDSL